MKALKEIHQSIYGTNAKTESFIPAVFTLLGTHTDYAGGSTLSIALDEGVKGVASPRVDRLIRLFFNGIDQEAFSLDLEHLEIQTKKPHHTMLTGIIKKLVHEGYDVSRGMDITLRSDIQKESDIGFTSAVLLNMLSLLLKQNGVSLSSEKQVRYVLHVEKETLGSLATPTEPVTMLNKKAGSLLFIDQFNEEIKQVPFDFDKYALLLLDTNRSPELSMNSIVKRMKQIDKGYEAINAKRSIETLGDLDIQKFNQFKPFITSPLVMKRVEHVIFENDRAKQGVEVINNHEYPLLGELFTQSHTSLKELLEVSCEELDYIVNDLIKMEALGAKMTGLGFGGCVVALFEKSAVPDSQTLDDLKKRYTKRFHKNLTLSHINPTQ